MSCMSPVDTTPDFLRTAMEYRDRLKAELAKVDDFLRQADKRPEAGTSDYPDFLLIGNDEVLEVLGPHGSGSGSIH